MPDPSEITHIRPFDLIAGADARTLCGRGAALPLAGGPLAFTHVEVISKNPSGGRQRSIYPVAELDGLFAGQADPARPLSTPTAPFAGLDLSGEGGRPRVMGIVNVTPDSFSDGGDYADADAAIAHGKALFAAGADIIDVGGESTRPGATPVSVEGEMARVMPVVTALAGAGITVSIDSRHAAVMAEAIAAGARIVNDVSALTHDPGAMDVIAASDASVILMHMQGSPESMQRAPHYEDVVLDVYDALAARVAACEAAGIAKSRICVDPGIGFGKTAAHNLALIASLAVFHGLGCAVGIGVSRKSFIDAVAGTSQPKDRLAGSLAAMLVALGQGAQIVRVHDVGETVQAVALWREAQTA
jgi:dihydropteroate synthase